MCTWAVLKTVDWYLKNGSEVFTCAMDMTKAFDLTLHSLLFRKMVKSGFPVIFIRLFIFIYMYQTANVRWNSEISIAFPNDQWLQARCCTFCYSILLLL